MPAPEPPDPAGAPPVQAGKGPGGPTLARGEAVPGSGAAEDAEATPGFGAAEDAEAHRLRARLRALEKEGARAFDAPGLTFVVALLERAEALGGGASERLRARAEARLDSLAEQLRAGRQSAAVTVDELAGHGLDPGAAEDAVARGDLVAVRRAARRHRAAAPREGRRPRHAAFTPAAPPEASSRPRRERARRKESESAGAARRYRSAFAELVTGLRVERARTALPAAPGPYNGQTIAARVIEAAAALSPVYAHSQLQRIDELATLALLPEPPAPRRKGKKRRR